MDVLTHHVDTVTHAVSAHCGRCKADSDRPIHVTCLSGPSRVRSDSVLTCRRRGVVRWSGAGASGAGACRCGAGEGW